MVMFPSQTLLPCFPNSCLGKASACCQTEQNLAHAAASLHSLCSVSWPFRSPGREVLAKNVSAVGQSGPADRSGICFAYNLLRKWKFRD